MLRNRVGPATNGALGPGTRANGWQDASGMSDDLHGWTGPAGVPDAETALHGARVTLEPLSAARHGDDLFAAAGDERDPALWKYLPYGPWPHDRAGFEAHLAEQEASADPRFYAVVG